MENKDLIGMVRGVEACPLHQEKQVPCPEGNEGCCVAHFRKFHALDSAACCNQCALLLAEALRRSSERKGSE